MAKKPPAPKISDLEKEYKKLIQTDKVKAQEIKKKLDYFNYGIL